MSEESLHLLESRLARLQSEHESRLLSVSQEPLKKFDPTRMKTFSESLSFYAESASAELANHIKLVSQEVITHVEQLMVPISSDLMSSVLSSAERTLDSSLYLRRFKLFEEAMLRKGRSYGLHLDEWGMGTDIITSLHHVGTENCIREALSALKDALELIRLRSNKYNFTATEHNESNLEQANRFIKLEPNFFGIGINFNYLIRRWLRKKE